MKIIVLMAGKGSRFTDVGYPAPKPFIEVNDKHILEWTTSSLPFINHHAKYQDHTLVFAILEEHEEQFEVSERLYSIYSDDIQIVRFNELTRGNLETAYKANFESREMSYAVGDRLTPEKLLKKWKCILEPQDEETQKHNLKAAILLKPQEIYAMGAKRPLLFLDSDNFYDGSDFEYSIKELHDFHGDNPFGMICYFDPIDNSSKWCFAIPGENENIKMTRPITELCEKDENALARGGKPMVGVFYFSQSRTFSTISQHILDSGEKTNDEFFMSQAINEMIKLGIPVYGLKVNDVVPLGTPADVIKARDELK